MIKEMAGQKEAYEKVSDAFEAVQVKRLWRCESGTFRYSKWKSRF